MEVQIRTEYREKQPYCAILQPVTMPEIPVKLPEVLMEVAGWLHRNNIKPAGPPFFNYINMQYEILEVEAGYPVDTDNLVNDERVKSGIFPEGKYAVATYIGPYSNLPLVHGSLAKWAKENDIIYTRPGTEFYLTDPQLQPDENKWITEIVVRITEDETLKKLSQKAPYIAVEIPFNN